MSGEISSLDKVKVVGICGSIRDNSYTRKALTIALAGAEQYGAETKLIDLRNYDLAFCAGNEYEDQYPDDVFRLREEVNNAQGILLGTPEYHGSFSGILKNAIDLMGFDEFAGKLVGLIGVSAGTMGALNALNSLRTVGRTLHAWVIPQQASVAESQKVFNSAGEITDIAVENRLLEVGRQVARFALLHNSSMAQEFLRFWEEAQPNPGGR